MMKRIWLYCALVFFAAFHVQAEFGHGLAVISAGDVDAALLESTRDYLEKNTGITTEVFEPLYVFDDDASMDDIARAALAHLPSEEVEAVIVLIDRETDEAQETSSVQNSAIVMNIAPLKAGADSEQLARRVGQKALRSAAALFGLSPCPFPLCVLVNYPNVESLDDMSGNYCPPCKDRLLRRAEELNLSIAAPAAD